MRLVPFVLFAAVLFSIAAVPAAAQSGWAGLWKQPLKRENHPPVQNGYMTDYSNGWVDYTVRDHLNLRLGYVRYNPSSQTYIYFDRYGHMQALAEYDDTAKKYTLYDRYGQIKGALYGKANHRLDPQLASGYPELFRADFDDLWDEVLDQYSRQQQRRYGAGSRLPGH